MNDARTSRLKALNFEGKPSLASHAGPEGRRRTSILSFTSSQEESEKRRKEKQLKRQIESFNEEQLWQVVQEVKDPNRGLAQQKTLVEQVARHPKASPRIWKELLKHGSSYSEFVISQIERARQIPQIREHLRTSDIPQVWVYLCRDARGEELTQLFGRVVQQNADTALSFIEEYPDKVDEIDEDLLTELLKTDDDLDRARVFRVLGRKHTDTDTARNDAAK